MIGSRENKILKYILAVRSNLQVIDLKQSLGITERQLSYSLKKINDELLQHNRNTINRLRNGELKFDTIDIQWIYLRSVNTKNEITYQSDFYIVPYFRPLLLFLIIQTCQDKVTIHFLETVLAVSRNTILKDLKKLSKFIEKRELSVLYLKDIGYVIEGELATQKRVIVQYTDELLSDDTNIHIMEKLLSTQKFQVLEFLSEFETFFSLRFSDSSFNKLYYIIDFYLSSSLKNREKTKSASDYLSVLREEKEYQFVESYVNRLGLNTSSDIEWITLLILSSNTISNNGVNNNIELYSTVSDMVAIFEQKSGIVFQDGDLLIGKLFFHLKPAVYRLTYGIPIFDNQFRKINESDIKNKTIYSILKYCLKPFERYMGCPIPDSEVELISYYFGSEIIKITQKNESIPHYKVGVVCSNGLIVAKIMFESLKQLFPELYFVTTCSKREFVTSYYRFDIVFTSIPLETDLPCYLISTILGEEEKKQLRQTVLEDLGIDSINNKTKEILEMINKYADIKNVNGLSMELDQMVNEKSSQEKVNLLEYYLTSERICKQTNFLSWEDALYEVGKKLISEGLATKAYTDTLMKQMAQVETHYFINQSIAIPHASPEEGVISEGCVILISEKPIYFPSGHKVHFIVAFALLENKYHLGALNQIIELSKNIPLQNKLLQTNKIDTLFKEITDI